MIGTGRNPQKKAELLQYVSAECIRECTSESIKHVKRIAGFDGTSKSKGVHLVEQSDLYVFMFREWIAKANGLEPYKYL